MRILVNTTPPSNPGGVANHYKGLKNYWKEEVRYNYIGGRYGISGAFLLPFDWVKFIIVCLWFRPNLVVLNPSLGVKAIKRDSIFLKTSKLLKLKIAVVFHGWNEDTEKKTEKNPDKFVNTFNKADVFFVLASAFQQKLINWGIAKPIHLTSTKIDNQLISEFKIEDKKYEKTLLFLGRIESEKGIFTALKTYQMVKRDFSEAKLIVAGDGSALSEAKEFVKSERLDDVDFRGYLRGNELINAYKESDIYLFPTTHGEGMPTSVLEAMAFGLAIVTRPVGGIKDFFENHKMGSLIDSVNPEEFAYWIKNILNDPQKLKEMGLYNHEYATKNFLASSVANKLEQIFKEMK